MKDNLPQTVAGSYRLPQEGNGSSLALPAQAGFRLTCSPPKRCATKLRRILLLLTLLIVVSGLHGYYYGMNKVNAADQGWTIIETMHFDIYYPRGNDEFGKLAALLSEEAYYYLRQDFQFPAMTRIPIVFYSSQMDFQVTNIIYPLLSEGVGGFTESLKNRVAIPFDGNYTNLEQTITHELTHAYVNALDNGTPGSFFYTKSYNFPFWFSEGLPEFEAVGGKDNKNNTYVMDLLLNDQFRSLNEVSGYSAYRLGEAFLVFLEARYGREKVIDYFYAVRTMNDMDQATKKTFGMKFADLEGRWKNQLKREYFPFMTSHTVPKEYAEIKTDRREDGSYFNLSPRFSPDGQKYIYFSNRNGRFSVWTDGLFDVSKKARLIVGEDSGKLEEFHYLRSTLSWFPDNNRFAFAAKTATGDVIYIADFAKSKIVQEYKIPDLNVIYEMDVAPDGQSCVLSGQRNMQTDIYRYFFDTRQLLSLTDDKYYDYQPRFDRAGTRIAFASERRKNPDAHRNGIFSGMFADVYTLNLADNVLQRITFDNSSCYFPVWDSTGTKLIYISERDSTPNLEIVDLLSGQRARVTQTLTGIYSYDLSYNDQQMVFSCLYNGGWDVYLKTAPLSGLSLTAYHEPQAVVFSDSLFQYVDLTKLDYFGKHPKPKIKPDKDLLMYRKGTTIWEAKAQNDTLRLHRDYSWDDRPDSITIVPKIKTYRPKFSLDKLWGGLAYSSSVGTIGSLELGLSDIMGNHAIGINLGVAGKLKDSNALVTYLYLPKRIDYGIGVFNQLDEVLRQYIKPGRDDFTNERTRETGLYCMARYPFSKFLRVDFENLLYTWENHIDYLVWNADSLAWETEADTDIQSGVPVPRPVETDLVYAPSLTFVHDNALYGPTGPMLGLRTFTTLRKSFAMHGNDYHTLYADIRSYSLFSKRYSIAVRMVGGYSGGKQPQKFGLNGYYGVRGNDTTETGTKTALASAELRFPFLDYFAMAFPMPITLGNIRGSVFSDIGTVWTDDKTFRGMQDDRLQDLMMGAGFGPRLNLGFAVLKLDIAWKTDLVYTSRPTYYFSLTEDF